MLEDRKTMLVDLKSTLSRAFRVFKTRWVYILTNLLWYVFLMSAPAAAQGILGMPDGVGMIVFLSLSFTMALVRSLFGFFRDGRQKKLWRYVQKEWYRYALVLFIAAVSFFIYSRTVSGT